MRKDKILVQNTSTKDDEIVAAIPAACADEKTSVEFMEKQRWGDHPCCPQCGDLSVYKMMDSKDATKRQANYRWRCNGCKAQYTVRIGTVYEESRIPLRHWCYAFWRASTSKKGVSALEIKRHTGLSYKSALFLLNRIRFAMEDDQTDKLSGDVEVDEVYIGGKPRYYGQSKRGRGTNKQAVVAVIERGGRVRTRPVPDVTGKTLKAIIRENVDKSARIMTDENKAYHGIGKEFDGGHETVCHSRGEYVRLGTDVHSNTVEAYFSIVRRGLDGIYHSVSKEHLHRYLAEFSFRHDHRFLSDGERTQKAIKKANGKRLMYQEPLNKQ
jgi:transposase-like protein